MLSTCKGAAADPGRGGAVPGAETQSNGHRGAQSGEERRQGLGVQEWPDGARYEGGFVNGFKHGEGKYTWRNGEYYEGSFYKDYRHGDGLYCWPTGHKFTGKFYLNRKEGYGQQLFPDGSTFQGLYHADQRFGPGVVSYPDVRQDVGLWLGERLLKLCASVEEGFSLRNLPEYAAYMDPAATTDSLIQVDSDRDLLSNENCILPPGIESYSTDGDHLPLPFGRRRELDQHFYGELWEPDVYPHQGYERDPLSKLPLQARMQAHIHKHRLQAENVGWDVAAVLSLNRERFGPKGPLEVSSELLIQHASQGELQAVSQILQTCLVHPDVADSQGHTALIAATVNCQNDVIQLLLDMGANIDKLNCEGMSALAVCHVLYYPFQSLHTISAEPPAKTQVMDGHIALGSVQWKDCRAKAAGRTQQGKLTPQPTFDSACSVSSYNIQVTEEVMQCSAEALSRTGIPQCSDTQETVRKMAAMKTEHRVCLNTLKLLLERGADPNVSRVPMPVLFLAIMAADAEAVKRLLLCGAHTDIPLPPERKGLYPLHVAAALPGPAGPRIIELLLHAVTDPDTRACDHNETYEPYKIFTKAQKPLSTSESSLLKEGGRTALHVACQRDSDYQNASKVVALLLSHSASTDFLWSGHSPLSLAIATGNDLAVEELLKGGANPSIPLGCSVGSALCALTNINYHLGGNRAKMLDLLAKAGADILMPVNLGDVEGTAVDYAHLSFNQDVHIANTPFHALNMRERETYTARRQLLIMMGDLLRRTAGQRERENSEREQQQCAAPPSCESPPPITEKHRKPPFKFCYHCGRSVSVKLTACNRCHKVYYCSTSCKLKAWDKQHKEECVRVSASFEGIQKSVVSKSQRSPRPLTAMVKSKTVPQPLSVKVKSPRVPKPLSMAEKVLESQINPKENYSCN
ncbi:ankyrin repeat and MYND domain-containing protein 1 [Pagrus major]|uniref:ankyrin repeat and MYND domain-containing protein 1 n=1 Tax=Pagrus major TaxID=143350 RepID=UPI003CC86EA2